MKKVFLVVLSIIMLISAVGCADDGEATPATGQTETTLVTQPTETTEESTEPEETLPVYDPVAGTEFTVADTFLLTPVYTYSGTDDTIELPGGEITLTLPEGWLERVNVTLHNVGGEDSWYLCVTNKAIMQAHNDLNDGEGYALNFFDYIFGIYAEKKPYEYDPVYDEYVDPVICYENEDYVYVIATADTHNPYHSNALRHQASLKSQIGEEGYQELVEDLVVTMDQVLQMLSFAD